MIDIEGVLSVARGVADKTLTDWVRLEARDNHPKRDTLGRLQDSWNKVYEGPGLVQAAGSGERALSAQQPVTIASYVAKLPHKFKLDPARTYRLTVVRSLDEKAQDRTFEVIADETNGWAILRRLRLEAS